jgi:hypothetical protein
MSSSTAASKTLFLLSLWLGFATGKIIELQSPGQETLSRTIECVVYWQTNEYGSEETMCHPRGSRIQEESGDHYLELPEMLELLYQDEIEQGLLLVSVANVEIEDDQVLWDEVSNFKVLEPSNTIICRVFVVQDEESSSSHQQTECIPVEHGIETSRMYKVNLPEPLTKQFAQAIQDGTLYLSMTGAMVDGDRLIAPEDESNIKVLVLEAEAE